MNIALMLFVIFESLLGIVIIVFIMASLIGMIGYKIFRKIRFHESLYD